MLSLCQRSFSSGHATGDEANAPSDHGSLQLPDQASVSPGRAVQPDPAGDSKDQQDDQASAREGIHRASTPELALSSAELFSGW